MWSSGRRALHYLGVGERGETNTPPISLHEGSNGGLRCGAVEWVAESKGAPVSCVFESDLRGGWSKPWCRFLQI